MKIRTQCYTNKQLSDFYVLKRGGFSSNCKDCIKIKQNNYYTNKVQESGKTPKRIPKCKIITLDDGTKLKVCSICNLSQKLENFSKKGRGLNSRCKECNRQYYLKYNQKTNYKNFKNWRNNPINKRKHKKLISKWYRKNKDKKLLKEKEHIHNDINYKISKNLRSRLYNALKNKYKNGSAVRDLGCSIEKFILWIEMHWQEGMSWNNYGKGGWHLDHIKPLSKFDLLNRNQLLEACNFTNYQPLWSEENLSKGAK